MQRTTQRTLILICLVCVNIIRLEAQEKIGSFFTPSDTFNTKRFYPLAGSGLALYTGAVIALDQAWYANQPRGKFRFFNDWPEWQQMDKMGHSMTAYWENAVLYKGARWTGMSKKNALITSASIATGLQLTIEIMDGFVETYGFSWTDVAFNQIGIGVFTAQEALWDQQFFVLKFSTRLQSYSNTPIFSTNGNAMSSPAIRARDLYGDFFAERWLKDYNAQTYWLSVFPSNFSQSQETILPKWLGFSVGYGANNMFGGRSNSWSEMGNHFSLTEEFPRYRQFYLSLDIDLTRIPVKSPFLKSLFSALNFIKIPFPTLEYNTLGQWRGHWLYF